MDRARPAEPPPQEVPNVILTNQPAVPSGKLFHIQRNSTVTDINNLEIDSFEFLPTEGRIFQNVQLITSFGGFLFKSFLNSDTNELKDELEDQIQMGMWNPYLVNMEDIEERYGKVVYYDEMDAMGRRLHGGGRLPLMTIDGVLSELPLADAENYCRTARPDDQLALLWAYQIADALKHCHEVRGIAHRDIRPRNVFVFHSGQHIKLGNFQYSSPVRLGNGERSREQMLYSAPEVLPEADTNGHLRESPMSRYGYSSDIYSLAMTIYRISHLRIPFEEVEEPETQLRRLVEEGTRPPLKQDITRTLRTLLVSCWRTEKRDSAGGIVPLEQRRPTAKTILNYLDYN